MNRLEIAIIGAGVGGLCLAQGLKRNGIRADVFERDASGSSPVEGYRISVSASGGRALKSCLPPETFETFAMSTGEPSRGVTFLDHEMNRLLSLDFPDSDRFSDESERPVGRTTLRRILLDGLDESVHFGKKFVSFRHEPDGRVTALFADGSQATADLLVGADGASSLVRAQLLPGVARTDTGIVAVGGKLALNEAVRAAVPAVLMRGPTPILGPNGCFLFVSAMQSGDHGPIGRADYVMWGFSARRERLGRGDAVERLDGRTLKGLVEGLMPAWHPALRDLVGTSDPETITAFAVKTSTPVRRWKTTNVTLLGDALHNMPPYRGVGANAALWDAALLRDTIVRVARGDCPVVEALSDYERRMIAHGFRAVRTSLAAMGQFHEESPVSRSLTKSFLRAVDRVSPLRAWMFAGR